MELTKNTILITGGTSGIGLELATRLLTMGNTVIVTGRSQARLDKVRKNLPGIHAYRSDVSQPEAIETLHDQVTRQFPALNVLINNAGEMRRLSLNDPTLDLTDLTREIDINLMGPIRMVQQFLPQLKAQKTAAILNVTSGLALVPFPVSPIYGATKAGLHSYTQSLRVQLKHTHVQVFELLAPAVNTPLNDKFLNEEGFDPKSMMEPGKLIDAAIKGMQKDQEAIYPGIANILRVMSRLAPKLILGQTSKVGIPFMQNGAQETLSTQ